MLDEEPDDDDPEDEEDDEEPDDEDPDEEDDDDPDDDESLEEFEEPDESLPALAGSLPELSFEPSLPSLDLPSWDDLSFEPPDSLRLSLR